jgi:hypothetical protein
MDEGTLGAMMAHEDRSQWRWRRGNLLSALGAQGSGAGGSGMGRRSEEEQVNLALIEDGIRAMTNVGARGVTRYWGGGNRGSGGPVGVAAVCGQW